MTSQRVSVQTRFSAIVRDAADAAVDSTVDAAIDAVPVDAASSTADADAPAACETVG